jgi:O-antigen/teichoic acid export membrane protein
MSLMPHAASGARVRTGLAALKGALLADSIEARTRRAAGLSVLARIANAVITLATHVMLARLLGAAGFGLFSMAVTWVLVLLGLATAGLAMAPQRFLPEYEARAAHGLLAGLYRWSHLVPLLAGAAIVLMGLCVLHGLPLGLSPEARLVLSLALLALPALALIDVVEGFALANEWTDLAQGVTFLLKPLLLPLLFVAGWLAGSNLLVMALVAYVASAWLAALVLVVLLRRRMAPRLAGASASAEPRRWAALALPAMLADAAFLLMAYADVLILSAVASPAETGVYAAATRIVGVVAFVHFGLSYAAAHHYAALHAEGRLDDLVRYARKAAVWTFWPSLLFGLIVALAAPLLLPVFGPGFGAGAGVVPVLVLALLVRAAIGPSEQLLMMTNRQALVTGIFALAASVNILLAVLLAPHLGAMGVALAMLAASIVAAAGSAIAIRHAFGSFVHAFHVAAYRRPAAHGPRPTIQDTVS